MVGKVVTMEWKKAKSTKPGICIRFSCRENIIQIKLETAPNLKQDFNYRRLSFIKIKFGRRQRLPISLRSGWVCRGRAQGTTDPRFNQEGSDFLKMLTKSSWCARQKLSSNWLIKSRLVEVFPSLGQGIDICHKHFPRIVQPNIWKRS